MRNTFVKSSVAAAKSLIVKTGKGRLLALYAHNDKNAAQYIQLHDSATVPADTAVPLFSQIAAADSNMTPIQIPEGGIPFVNGLVVCNSSTLATKTIGSDDCFFTAVWGEM